MMTDFAADLSAIMNDGLAVDAVYFADFTGGVGVRVIRKSPDEVGRFGESLLRTETSVLLVACSDIENPTAGAWFYIGTEMLVVQGAPLRDARRLRWQIEVAPA